jgi:predicted nucleic acid-binding Zn ribbon protein
VSDDVSRESSEPPGSDVSSPGRDGNRQDDADSGVDAVRSALNRARAAARAKPAVTRGRRRRPPAGRSSGAGPDARDPQTFGSSIERLVAERGWDTPVAVGGVMGRWDTVVGPDVAGHCRPDSFEDGVLTVVAESTAWATQVRLLVPTLFRRLAEEVGTGTVTKIVVQGPQAPSWRRGTRVAPGSQGPRDTYG